MRVRWSGWCAGIVSAVALVGCMPVAVTPASPAANTMPPATIAPATSTPMAITPVATGTPMITGTPIATATQVAAETPVAAEEGDAMAAHGSIDDSSMDDSSMDDSSMDDTSMNDSIVDQAVAQARQLLAAHLGIAAEQITVREVRRVTWPDASLGCPQPDMLYAQVQQAGLLITLGVDGASYRYHSGADGEPFLCEAKSLLSPTPKFDERVPPPDSEID